MLCVELEGSEFRAKRAELRRRVEEEFRGPGKIPIEAERNRAG